MKMKAMFVIAIIACTQCLHAQVMSDHSGLMADYELAIPFIELNSEADEYGVAWDKTQRRMSWTTSRSGSAEVWLSTEEGKDGHRAEGTFNVRGRSRSYVSFGSGGEAVGVAFVRGERQSSPTIVTVPTDNGYLNTGHPVSTIGSLHFNAQPALSPDGTRLVFVSNRPGGSGALDLWVCDRRGQLEWSEPVLLSTIVNSPGDEITPSFLSNDSLVYASNGYGGKGGFDLYLTVSLEGAWQEPEPLAWINTEFDESDMTVLGNGNIVFASNRPGSAGGLDLWIVRRRKS